MQSNPFDVEFDSDDDDAGAPTDWEEPYTGAQPLLLRPAGFGDGKRCLRVTTDKRYVVGLTIDITEGANDMRAHCGAIAFVPALLKTGYDAEVGATSIDVDAQTYRICLFVPEARIIPLKNYTTDGSLLLAVNNVYQEKERSPTLRVTSDWNLSSAVKLRNWVRTKPKLQCFQPVLGIRPLPYSGLAFCFIKSYDELAAYDPEGEARVLVDLPPPFAYVGDDGDGLLIPASESTLSDAGTADGRQRLTLDEYRRRKNGLDAEGRKQLRAEMWSQMADEDE